MMDFLLAVYLTQSEKVSRSLPLSRGTLVRKTAVT